MDALYILGGLAVAAAGAFALLCPRAYYDLTESWKSDTPGEPSRLFLISTRFGGAVCLVLGAVCTLILLLSP